MQKPISELILRWFDSGFQRYCLLLLYFVGRLWGYCFRDWREYFCFLCFRLVLHCAVRQWKRFCRLFELIIVNVSEKVYQSQFPNIFTENVEKQVCLWCFFLSIACTKVKVIQYIKLYCFSLCYIISYNMCGGSCNGLWMDL